jgi:predicted dehydrogenase
VGGLHVKGLVETERGSYMGYYDNIYEVIREKGKLVVKPEQAWLTMAIIEAAIKSNEDKKVISFDKQHPQP